MDEMPADFTFTFHQDQRNQFRNGSLIEYWSSRYPEIFDSDDLRVLETEHQRRYHFFEWLSAILLFEATGYHSLLESYTSQSHRQKQCRFRETVGEELFAWACDHQSGQPDLFVFRPGYDWFFCEVKGGPDRIRDNQRNWASQFKQFQQDRGQSHVGRVRIVQLIECAPKSLHRPEAVGRPSFVGPLEP